MRQFLIRGLEVDFCSLPFRKKLYRRSIKNPNPFPIWKIWFGLYAFGAPGRSRTCGLQSRSLTLYPAELWAHAALLLYHIEDRMQARIKKLAARAPRRGGFAQKGRGRKRCIGKERCERQIMQAYESGTGIKNTYPHIR